MKPVQLLILTGIYPPDIGGPATYLAQFVPAMQLKGVAMTVVSFGDVPMRTAADEHGVRVVRIPRKEMTTMRLLRYWHAAHSAARGADVMYVHDMSMVGLVGRLISISHRLPYLIRIGGDFVWEQAYQRGATQLSYEAFQGNESIADRLRRTLGVWILRGAKRVIVPSAFLRTIVLRWGLDPEVVRVVLNAIEPIPETNSVPQYVDRVLKSGKRLIVTSGRFVSWKHFDAVIDAVSNLPDVHLLIAGDGPLRSSYEALIAQCSLTDRVTITGALSRADLFSVLRHADRFVLPSEGETFSFVTLEALMMGTPVVLARKSALPELFLPYEGTGVTFVEEPTVQALTVALATPLTRPDQRVIDGLKHRFDIQRHFDAVYGIVREISSV